MRLFLTRALPIVVLAALPMISWAADKVVAAACCCCPHCCP